MTGSGLTSFFSSVSPRSGAATVKVELAGAVASAVGGESEVLVEVAFKVSGEGEDEGSVEDAVEDEGEGAVEVEVLGHLEVSGQFDIANDQSAQIARQCIEPTIPASRLLNHQSRSQTRV